MADDLRAVLGAVDAELARRADPAGILLAASLERDPWQVGILCSRAKRIAILGARQGAGKSTVAGARAVVESYSPGRHTIITGPSHSQSIEVLTKAARIIRDAGFIGRLVDADAVQATRITFHNGSTIRALSSNEATGRGRTAHLAIVTEAALASDDLIDYTVSPWLATTDGVLILESTPFGKRGAFWSACSGQREGWEVHTRPIEECTRVSAGFLAGERAKGPLYYDQEYRCVFHDAVGSYFPADAIERAFRDGVRPLFPGSPWVDENYRPPEARLDGGVRALFGGVP